MVILQVTLNGTSIAGLIIMGVALIGLIITTIVKYSEKEYNRATSTLQTVFIIIAFIGQIVAIVGKCL